MAKSGRVIEDPSLRSPTADEVTAMYRGLKDRGVVASVRWPKGREAAGACGQLALRTAGSSPIDADTAAAG